MAQQVDRVHADYPGARGVGHAVRHFRRAAVIVEVEVVSLFLQLDGHLGEGVQDTDGVDELDEAVGAVVPGADALAGGLPRDLDDVAEDPGEVPGGGLLDDGRQALLHHSEAGHPGLDVQGKGAGVADHVVEIVEDVFFHPVVLGDFQGRDLEALLVHAAGAGGHAAGLAGAALPGVDHGPYPADQLAPVENRRVDTHVQGVGAADIGGVTEEGVPRLDADAGVVEPVLHDVFYVRGAQHRVEVEAGGADGAVAGPGIDGAGRVSPAAAGAGAQLDQGLVALRGDGVELVEENARRGGLDVLHVIELFPGGRLRV